MAEPQKSSVVDRPLGKGQALRLNLLGQFQLTTNNGEALVVATKKNRALLAILALAPGGRATRERLCGLLWGDKDEEQARSSLRQSLTGLRRELGLASAVISTDDNALVVDTQQINVDVLEFQHLSLQTDEVELMHAAKLYRGDLLADYVNNEEAFEDWLQNSRQKLIDRAMAVLERLATSTKVADRAAYANRLVELEPLREASHRILMEAHVAMGDRGLALKQYEICRALLLKELAVEPAPETQELRRLVTVSTPAHLPASESKAEALRKPDDKPSIAVLPFSNLSGDPDQLYFADGITEDVITGLARFRSLRVVARSSSFALRGKVSSLGEIAEQLGVDYVLEGSVRKIGLRVRIAAQLIDAVTGNHVWAERYDRPLDDIFAVQDEVAQMIVSTLTGRMQAEKIHSALQKPTPNHAAYDFFLRGVMHLRGYGPDDNELALKMFANATELDQNYAPAHAFKALSLVFMHRQNGDGLVPPDVLSVALEHGMNAVGIDPQDSRCYRALLVVCLFRKEYDQAEHHARQAVAFNPNDSDEMSMLARVLTMRGRGEEAFEWLERAKRLNPFHPAYYHVAHGETLHLMRRYEGAIGAYGLVPGVNRSIRSRLAACCGQLGRTLEAKEHVDELMRKRPDLCADDYVQRDFVFEQAEDRDHFLTGLVKAGLPARA
jgi:TolB-like protein